MYRWTIGGILAGLILLIVISGHGATKTSYVNGLPLYSHIPGQEFIFERDCYIFKLKTATSDWPYVASHTTVPDLPSEVDTKYIGADYPNVRILDTVSVGTHFRIVSVRRDQKAGKTNITYEILLADEATRKYPRVDALYLLNRTAEDPSSPPSIVPDYAVPRRSN